MTTKPNHPITLYRTELSGHCHRVQLFMSLTGIAFRMVDIDVMGGEQRNPPYLAVNPFGLVPAIDDGGIVIADSCAILVYLARCYAPPAWLPRDPVGAAQVQQFLALAAGAQAYGPNAARLIKQFGAPMDYPQAERVSGWLLAQLERHLKSKTFMVGAAPTIADVALYSYVAHAPEGGIALDPYPQVQRWLARIEALPGFVPMAARPLPQL